MSLRLGQMLFAAFTTFALAATGCGPTDPAASSANVRAPATQAEAAKPETPIPGANATQRAANVRIVLLGQASKAKGDVAKFVAEADAFFAERKEGLARLEVELAARNKELGSSPDAKQKILDQAPDEMQMIMKAQAMLGMDQRAFMADPEVKKRLGRIGL